MRESAGEGQTAAEVAVHYNDATQSFPVGEGPGISVFFKDEAGDVFHTYSSYARGLDIFLGAYHLLDIVPKGRDEDGFPESIRQCIVSTHESATKATGAR